MKTFSVLALGVIVSVCLVPRGDAAPQFDRGNNQQRGDRVCVYKDINYLGAQQCYNAGDEINDLGVNNKSISSIRVYGRATVTVYEKEAFGGHSAEFTSDIADLGRRAMSGNTVWSDNIKSLRIGGVSTTGYNNTNDRRNQSNFPGNQSQQPRDGICVYDRANYEGRSECWNQGQNISDLTRQGRWNGQISSIRLFGRSVAVVYQEIGYRGESLTVDRDIPDLAAIRGRRNGNGNGNGNNGNGNGNGNGNRRRFENWDHQISSLQVQSLRRDR